MHSSDVRILIVERNPRMRDFLRREFSKRNFMVEGASCGSELFAKLDCGAATHILIMDVNTSEGTGRELLQQVINRYPHIPVILHTYLQDLSEDPSLLKVKAMVEKNGNPDNLTRMVARVFEELYPNLIKNERSEKSHV